MDEDRIRMSDVPTGQIPSAENQQLVNPKALQLATMLANYKQQPGMTARDKMFLDEVVQFLDAVAVGAVAVDTNEGCETGSLPHTGTKD